MLISLAVIFIGACSDDDVSIDDDPSDSDYLTVQMRADAGDGEVTLDWQMLPRAERTAFIIWKTMMKVNPVRKK